MTTSVDIRPRMPPTARHHADAVRRQPVLPQRSVARVSVQHTAQESARVALQIRFGDTGRLEVQLIEHRILGLRHHRGGTHRRARPERHTERHHRPEAIRAEQRRVPCDRSTPVVAGNHRRRLAQRIEQSHHVAGKMKQRVLVDRIGGIGPAVAAHVRRHRMEARLGQGTKLMTPGVPGFRKSMTQQNQRSGAHLGDVHPNAIGLHRAMRHVAHHRPQVSNRSGIRIPRLSGTFHTSRT